MESLEAQDSVKQVAIIADRSSINHINQAGEEIGSVSVRQLDFEDMDGALRSAAEIDEIHDACISGTRPDTEVRRRQGQLALYLFNNRESVIGVVITTSHDDLTSFWNRANAANGGSVINSLNTDTEEK